MPVQTRPRNPRTLLGVVRWLRRAHGGAWFATPAPGTPGASSPSPLWPELAWPDGRTPAKAAVYVCNEMRLPVPIQEVFSALCRPTSWPAMYANASRVRTRDGDLLRMGSHFDWRTMGMRQRSQVLVFEPPNGIAWDARGFGTRAIHRWRLQSDPHDATCTLVRTEELQWGPVIRLSARWLRKAMHATHEAWLEGLASLPNGASPDVRAGPVGSAASTA